MAGKVLTIDTKTLASRGDNTRQTRPQCAGGARRKRAPLGADELAALGFETSSSLMLQRGRGSTSGLLQHRENWAAFGQRALKKSGTVRIRHDGFEVLRREPAG